MNSTEISSKSSDSGIWHLIITGFVDSAHHLVFQTEQVLETGSVSVLRWKGGEVSAQMDPLEITPILGMQIFPKLEGGSLV
jgi:hypothetical protein